MRKLIKIITTIVVIVLLFSIVGIFQNESKAATYLINEANLYSKGEMVSFTYKGMGVGVQFVVYQKDGIEYPAYCLNRNLMGVTEEKQFEVSVSKTIENVAVWRAIINGYPFKTPSELKCNNDAEAFAATKMAVYDALYTYDWSDFSAVNDQGKRVLAAAESIAKKARSSNETKPVGKVEIKKVTEEWNVDNIESTYISRTYKVDTNVESTKYTIKLSGVYQNCAKLTDENNKEKTEFTSGEVFKVLIPIAELDSKLDINRKFNIRATADLKTKPILYGETSKSTYQDYALAAGEWEFESTLIEDQYPSNKTSLKIIKQDAETKNKLEGAKFNILDKDKNIIYTDVTTNHEGIAEISNILPGKYYIEEIQSPDGYTKYEGLVEIDVAFNQKYTMNMNNYQNPTKEEKEVEDKKEITVTGEKEIALPRTGF